MLVRTRQSDKMPVFFYGEPHNVFLDLIFPVTVSRMCIIYGDKADYLRFVAIDGVLG